MSDLTFGLTMTIVGMTGTLFSLWLLSLLISGLKKVCPLKAEQGSATPGREN